MEHSVQSSGAPSTFLLVSSETTPHRPGSHSTICAEEYAFPREKAPTWEGVALEMEPFIFVIRFNPTGIGMA